MPRLKIIPDIAVLATVRQMLRDGGEKAVSFATVARATELAPSTLVQRFSTRTGLVAAALLDGWDLLDAARRQAAEATSGKSPQAFLKALQAETPAGMALPDLARLGLASREAEARRRAADWRTGVEAELATRLGHGEKARDGARMLFLIWQGQALWDTALDDDARSLRLKDVVRRLG